MTNEHAEIVAAEAVACFVDFTESGELHHACEETSVTWFCSHLQQRLASCITQVLTTTKVTLSNDELQRKLAELSAQCDTSREQTAVNGVLCALVASMFDNSQVQLLRCIQPYINSSGGPIIS